ncbi:PASTA domain-containing protein [Paraeggerthella hongkongensis]|uniref:PASTA domain-containing protein n=1 Tax=Paraeggerthella TaxID=651554 RepID=UPI001C0FE2D7|nr:MULTISPECIES: PASTA domain-containing protein [Paraeggerthella]MBU5404460.1 PASTA domain-containing protein [Paraeggerthella hongkongensis]MCD2432156.1 PASTA domain-containing protein [Paraeggerthella hominis]
MICPHCHSENRDGAKFCNECGLPLSGKIAEVAAAVDADRESLAPVPEAANDDELDPDFAGSVSSDEEEPTAGVQAGSSGPLDPAKLPAIDVAGVNVDEDGNAFDFSPSDEEAVSDEASEEPPTRDDDLTPFIPKRSQEDFEAGRTADLSGLDECLVDSNYVPPQSSWRSGGTMEMPRIEGGAAPKQKEFRAPDPNAKKGGKGKVVAIVLACLVAAAGIAAVATYQMELWGGKILPNVVGMTQTDATYVLEGKGFAVRTMQVKSDETEGVVLLMDPGAGARQDEGTEVVIHVSEARVVPETVGIQRDEAAAKLKEFGFENVKFVTQKSDEREGIVLAVSPEAGTKAKANEPVTVTVAAAYTVPDITGMTWDQAVAAIEAEGLTATSAYVYDDAAADGTILGTSPAAGEKVASGSSVTVNIARSRGAELTAAAQAYLASAGTVNIGGTTYAIQSVDGITYQGNDTTAFTITAAAITTLDGETVRGSYKQKSGVIVWDSANSIVSIS